MKEQQSKQRTESPIHTKFQIMITDNMITDNMITDNMITDNMITDNGESGDGVLDAAFLNWIYNLRGRKEPALPRSEFIQYCQTHYECLPEPSYNKSHVFRRTLSPVVPYEMSYASEWTQTHNFEKLERYKKNMTHGLLTPEYMSYKELPCQLCQPSELEGRDILIKQLSAGLSDEAIKHLNSMGKKRFPTGILGFNGKEAVDDAWKQMRSVRRGQGSEDYNSGGSNNRRTNTMLQESSRKMYEMLHETEHRLLAIQAGSTYLQHVAACRVRRQLENKLKHSTDDDKYKPMVPQQMLKDSPQTFRLNRKKRAPSSPRSFRTVVEEIIASKIHHQGTRFQRKKQLFFNKLSCIYILLCTMNNMKPPKPGEGPLSWAVLKKLRADPYSHLTCDNQVKSRRDAIVGLTKTTVSSDKLPMVAAKKKSDSLNKDKMLAAEESVKSSKKYVNLMNSSVDTSTTASSDATTGRITALLSPKAELIPNVLSNSSRTSDNAGLKKTSVKDLKNVRSRNEFPKATSNGHLNSNNTPPAVEVTVARDNDMFDPAAISWDEFIKWGSNKDPKDKKARFSPFKVQKKPTAVFSTAAFRESTNKKPIMYSNSLHSIKKSISHLWQTLRKSFLQYSKSTATMRFRERKTSSKNESLMKKLGLQTANSINHSKFNWMRIKLRGNKKLTKEIFQRQRDAESRYVSVKHSKEITDTTRWKHTWMQDFQATRHAVQREKTDQYIECVEDLKEEAQDLSLDGNPLITVLIQKIKLVCSDEKINYMTIYRGQARMSVIVLSMPAFELCTLPMQLAMQFVLSEVLNGEADLLFPMFKQRGLPLHPGILDNQESHSLNLPKLNKINIRDFVETNKILSSVPPAKPGMSRSLLARVEKNFIYR